MPTFRAGRRPPLRAPRRAPAGVVVDVAWLGRYKPKTSTRTAHATMAGTTRMTDTSLIRVGPGFARRSTATCVSVAESRGASRHRPDAHLWRIWATGRLGSPPVSRVGDLPVDLPGAVESIAPLPVLHTVSMELVHFAPTSAVRTSQSHRSARLESDTHVSSSNADVEDLREVRGTQHARSGTLRSRTGPRLAPHRFELAYRHLSPGPTSSHSV